MPSFSTTAINLNPNAAVGVAGFCLIQLLSFAMSALRINFGNFFVATVILLLLFFAVFPYKTLPNPTLTSFWFLQNPDSPALLRFSFSVVAVGLQRQRTNSSTTILQVFSYLRSSDPMILFLYICFHQKSFSR